MLLIIDNFSSVDENKLMGVYAESNRENVSYFYPDCTDIGEGVKLVEQGFLNFLKTEFFAANGNKYFVWEERGEWVSALRINLVEDIYYMEALETSPEHRKKGYAAKLLCAVIDSLKDGGRSKICSSVGKRNIPSIATHKKCGFVIESEVAKDYLCGGEDEACYGMAYNF